MWIMWLSARADSSSCPVSREGWLEWNAGARRMPERAHRVLQERFNMVGVTLATGLEIMPPSLRICPMRNAV